jgi:hypothetical protein
VERRILPHQDHVDIAAEIKTARFADAEVIAGDWLYSHWPRVGDQAIVRIECQIAHVVVEQFMAARLRAQH